MSTVKTTDYQVETVTDLDSLLALRETWNALAASTPGAQFFQTFDWFATYWQHFGSRGQDRSQHAVHQQIHVLVIRQEKEVVGIVPLVIRTENRRIGRVRVLTFPLDDWGSCFGPVGVDPQIIPAALAHIQHERKRWDILSWRWLAQAETTHAQILDCMESMRLQTHASVRQTSAIIDLPATWDDYLASRGSKFRNNMKRWQRRVEEAGELRFEKFRPTAVEAKADPRLDIYDICVGIAERSWQGTSTTGTTLSHGSVRDFLRDMHLTAARAGAADMNLLYLNNQPIAFEYGYCWQGTKYSLRFGFDKETCDAGVGNLLWLKTIEASLAAGDKVFDMGPGSLDYKRYFYTRTVDAITLDYFRPLAPKAQLIAWKKTWDAWREAEPRGPTE